jgi:formate hydrogenlyase subunit 3/multisubunit Na+/H+ antiporter MnhD subunit
VIGMAGAALTTLSAGALVRKILEVGAFRYSVGGWGAPIGIDLRVDGLSATMVAMTAVVGFFVSLYAGGYFRSKPSEVTSQRSKDVRAERRRYFWPLWLLLWGSINALFVSSDIFNLYVTLELVGLSAVALVALSGGRGLGGAMRYLLVTLAASMFYLLGVALLYAGFDTLDLTLLGARIGPGPIAWAALALMTGAMVLKTALFPLHFWLPPAHSSAPAPVSAVLSALVVKASFYLMIRLWHDVFADVVPVILADLLSTLGVAAILWGSVQALLQTRLKLLVAYSTVAQLGYLFVILAPGTNGSLDAWKGGVYYAVSHACAKSAMFMVAGNFDRALGGDSIKAMRGKPRALRVSFFAFALAGVSLMGLPPSGGFIAKWLIVSSAIESGDWIVVVGVFVGGLLAAGYVFKVLRMAFAEAEEDFARDLEPVPLIMQLAPLGLALIAILLGLMAVEPLALLDIGEPFAREIGGSP